MENWEDKRDRLFLRDNYICRRCRKQTSRLSLHHIIPRELYGSDDDNNLITLCDDCHDWVELNLFFDPLLRTRTGIINSMPTVNYRIMNILNKPQPGYQQLGDKADIWTLWVKQGRKGAAELIKKYGSTSEHPLVIKPEAVMPTEPISESGTKSLLEQVMEEQRESRDK